MAEIAVLGRRAEVALFHALGLETVFAETAAEAETHFVRLVKEGRAVICVSGEWWTALKPRLAPLADRPLPAVLPLPGSGGGAAQKALDEAVARAVGTQLS